jgi:hypothetical protein
MQHIAAAEVTPKSPLIPLFAKGEFFSVSSLTLSLEKERGRGDF